MHDEPQGVRRAMALLRASIRAVVITAFLLLAAPTQQAGSAQDDGADLQRVMSRHDCRPTGFAAHPEASAALVRNPDGEIEVVDRQAGKAVYAGEQPGTLLAVCGV